MGWLIQRFRLQPFIVTLGRDVPDARAVLPDQHRLDQHHRCRLQATPRSSQARVPLWGRRCVESRSARSSRWRWWPSASSSPRAPSSGRTVYAIGGSEASAVLMGLPVARTTVLVYTFSGFFCSALAGVAFTFYIAVGLRAARGRSRARCDRRGRHRRPPCSAAASAM